ncbi:MAG: cupin domain-containing protein [Caldilineaceae bacterium]
MLPRAVYGLPEVDRPDEGHVRIYNRPAADASDTTVIPVRPGSIVVTPATFDHAAGHCFENCFAMPHRYSGFCVAVSFYWVRRSGWRVAGGGWRRIKIFLICEKGKQFMLLMTILPNPPSRASAATCLTKIWRLMRCACTYPKLRPNRVHAPHQHGGIEAVYMLEGEATIEIEGESFTLGPGEAVVFDPAQNARYCE